MAVIVVCPGLTPLARPPVLVSHLLLIVATAVFELDQVASPVIA